MTSTAASENRPTALDRTSRWILDHDGDMYGDERERLHWYEGMTMAAYTQWICVPWAAAALVWIYGRPVITPLAVILAVVYLPMALCLVYVLRHRVDTTPRTWSAKRVSLTVLGVLPYSVFFLGGARSASGHLRGFLLGTAVGVLAGAGAACARFALKATQRRREESTTLPDVD